MESHSDGSFRIRPSWGDRPGARLAFAAAAAVVPALSAGAALAPENVLLLYNSVNAESLAVRNAYVAARPGVVQLDLNNALLATTGVTRFVYVDHIRNPVRNFINGVGGGTDLSQQIMAIATTRGLPGRILSTVGTDEFQINSTWASLESELAVLQQDLEAVGSGSLAFRYSGTIDNPYHQALGQPIDSFSRASVQTARTFTAVGGGQNMAWSVTGLGPGDIYLVCRLDSSPTNPGQAGEVTAVQNVELLIDRSLNLKVDRCQVQALLDEYGVPPASFELDNGGFGVLFPARNDFDNAAPALSAMGIPVLHDKSMDFFTGPELPDQVRRLLVLGTYGENHSVNGWGENPPGDGTYLSTHALDPAAIFLAYESFGGTTIYSNTGRGGQQQALDFIAQGGSFTIATVMEPFTFAIADLEYLLPNLLDHDLTFAEAAYSSIPALSWQNSPVGDPLATVTLFVPGDADASGGVNFTDVLTILANFGGSGPIGDADCDGDVDFGDVLSVLANFGIICI